MLLLFRSDTLFNCFLWEGPHVNRSFYRNKVGPFLTLDGCEPDIIKQNTQAVIAHQYDRIGLKWDGLQLVNFTEFC